MALLSRWVRPLPLARSLLALGCMAAAGRELRAQGAPPASEQEVKAAYLFNFSRYVDWPADAFDAPEAPVNLCILGEPEFGGIVREAVEGRRSRGRPVRVVEPDEPSQAADCHIAFLPSAPREARFWLHALRGAATLTVGDGPGFVANRIQFAMFREAARIVEAGLATPAQVDEVVRSSFGFRLPFFGPFTIADLAGLDVYADIYATLERELGEDFHVPAAVEERVARGDFGVKTGRGFLDISPEEGRRLVERRDAARDDVAGLREEVGLA